MSKKRASVVVVGLSVSFFAVAFLGSGAGPDVDERPAAIDHLLSLTFADNDPGAAAIVVQRGTVLLRRGYGLADLELGVPVTPDMVFRIGSVTKSFTAIAVLTLVQGGALALDGDIRDQLPDLPALNRPVTIRQLLSHTAGLADLFDESYYELLENRAHALLNDEVQPSEFVKLIANQEPLSEPGEAWTYSNAGYFLLGQVIEKNSSTTYAEYIDEVIATPLGLERTGYYQNLAVVPGRVKSYLQDDDGSFIRNPYDCLSGVATYAAGGLVSTVDDLGRLNAAIDSGLVLDPQHRELMFTPVSGVLGGSTQYAMGWFTTRLRGRTAFHHGGDIYGYSATMWRVPEDELFVAILSAHPAVNSHDLELLAKRALAIVWGEPFPEWERISSAAAELEPFAGRYRFGPDVMREVSVDGGHIFTQRNGGRKVEMFPTTSGDFVFDGSLSYVTFNRENLGDVQAMLMHRDSGETEIGTRERP